MYIYIYIYIYKTKLSQGDWTHQYASCDDRSDKPKHRKKLDRSQNRFFIFIFGCPPWKKRL